MNRTAILATVAALALATQATAATRHHKARGMTSGSASTRALNQQQLAQIDQKMTASGGAAMSSDATSRAAPPARDNMAGQGSMSGQAPADSAAPTPTPGATSTSGATSGSTMSPAAPTDSSGNANVPAAAPTYNGQPPSSDPAPNPPTADSPPK